MTDRDIAVGIAVALLVALLVLVLIGWHERRRRRQPPPSTTYGVPVAYGLDFSWGRPPVDAILAGGYSFVCRYLSWSQSGKNLTKGEADGYLAAGIDIVSNWEYDAHEALGGYVAGVENALEADRQHLACGGPPGAPIFFSVDWDCQPWDYPAVVEYFRGIASVLGIDRTGAYGGVQVISNLFDECLISYGWQTYAWSYGAWDPRAGLRQVLNGQEIEGHAVDFNEAWADDYGGWGTRPQPSKRGDGTVLLYCPTDPDRIDLFWVGPNYEVHHRWGRGGLDDLWNGGGSVENLGGRIAPGTLTAAWQPDGTAVSIAGLGQADTPGPPGCGQYWGYRAGVDGSKSGWGSFDDVYGPAPGTAKR
jgi:Domain of unknown function (DUF1906)